MCKIEQLLATCEASCRSGGAQLMNWRGKFVAQEKSARDLVTDADIASQEAIRDVVLADFPDHGFLGEESPDPAQLENAFCWVVDPLDGTTNYVHGFPCFAVSVAVAHQGKLVAGGVYDPQREEMFLAGAGKGTTLNGAPIRTSEVQDLDSALMAVSFPPRLTLEMPDARAFLKLAPQCQAVRRTGSAALNLAYVACGRLDAHWAFQINPWDSAAGVLLVQEAGGTVSAAAGTPYDLQHGDYLVAATDILHSRVREEMTER